MGYSPWGPKESDMTEYAHRAFKVVTLAISFSLSKLNLSIVFNRLMAQRYNFILDCANNSH